MKKLEDFQSEKVELKNVFGGESTPTSSSSVNSAGCTVSVSDSYNDKNCNGLWDVGETGMTCSLVKC